MVRNVPFVLIDLRHRDHVAVVRARRDGGAVERLEPLGGGDAGRETARDVHGHVMAADGDGVGMDQMPVGEDADAGGAAAHVDDGAAHVGFVVDEGGEARRVRRGDHRLDAEMAALDREHEVARGRGLGGDHMQIDAEPLADHAGGIDDVVLRIEREAGGQSMQHGPAAAAGRGSLAASSTRCTSPAPTAPRTGTCASKCSEPRRPPVRLTITDWISTFAIRSAA